MLKPNQIRRLRAGGDHAITDNCTKSTSLQLEAETAVHLLDDWFDPTEAGLCDRVREFIHGMIEGELEAALSRPRYARRPKTHDEHADGPSGVSGHRYGHRSRSLTGTFGRVEIAVPRVRLDTADGKTTEWKSKGAAGLPAAIQACRCADRGGLSCRDQHAPGAPGAQKLANKPIDLAA